MKSIARIKEDRIARLKAEVNLTINNTPVVLSCVYKRTEQRNQYLMGWHSVTPLDIDIAISRARGELSLAHHHVQLTMEQLRANL